MRDWDWDSLLLPLHDDATCTRMETPRSMCCHEYPNHRASIPSILQLVVPTNNNHPGAPELRKKVDCHGKHADQLSLTEAVSNSIAKVS